MADRRLVAWRGKDGMEAHVRQGVEPSTVMKCGARLPGLGASKADTDTIVQARTKQQIESYAAGSRVYFCARCFR